METSRREKGSRLAGIEGLRAVAATSVLVFHVYTDGAPDGDTVDLGPLTKVVAHGRSGVTLFFVLSGFLLYRVFVSAALRGRPMPSVRHYLRNRALRILPAYWVILLGVVLVVEHQLLTRPLQLAANMLLLQNYVPAYIPVADDDVGIAPAWSIVVEVSFYLLLPLLGYLAIRLVRRGTVLAALTPVALMFAVGFTSKGLSRPLDVESDALWIVEHTLPSNADWFAAGMAVAVAHVLWQDGRLRLPRFWRPLALAAALALVLGATKLFYVGAIKGHAEQTPIALACALVLALIVLSGPESMGLRVLGSRAFVYAGLISYSVFLVNDPLVRAFNEWGLTAGGAGGFVLNVALVGSVSFVLAALTYRFVERPALARKRRWQAGDSAGLGSSAPPRAEEPAPADVRVPLRTALERAVLAVTGELREDVRIDVKSAGDRPVLLRDVEGVVGPLLDNALRYGSAPVTLAVESDAEGLRVTVEDVGRGVDPGFAPRLFEPHARSEVSAASSPGAGLGLCSARSAARERGGDVLYEPRPGGGARFVAVLGSADEDLAKQSTIASGEEKPSRAPPRRGRLAAIGALRRSYISVANARYAQPRPSLIRGIAGRVGVSNNG